MPRRSGFWSILAIAALITLPGCREEEQNRVLHIEKGTYAGAPDTELSEEKRRELDARARAQRFP
ncbi:hypothetical protein HPQ64_11725 [Rhizobiales bacterium]|uniref:hypothetical protein n=1 Tax=Hongsoonwoonella zoysiae TaxID=2821844 RepID=UPI00155F7A93|nr:hypothetical protein [Hongsoonwoonella zoysiae]NRG18359.1 hypothetical protein [Hongsoonwoonella zoysiae]